MKRQHQETLRLIFNRPVSGNIRWKEIEALLLALGAEIEERAGSR
ncbi:hexulose-6-phosphate synthase, partial [Aquitalea sp. LB_tupeE]|nr:hexulose-6-phosphate synthase [Aquitalea sp. LB_tupeE]